MSTAQTAAPVEARLPLHLIDFLVTQHKDGTAQKDLKMWAIDAASLLEQIAATPPAQAAPVGVSLSLDFKQATELLAMYGGEPSEITLIQGDGHSGKGIYAHYTEYPEEGAEFLGVADDDATPTQPAAQPAGVMCEWSEEDEDGTWATGCGDRFTFVSDGPDENDFRHCCYCGGSVTVKP